MKPIFAVCLIATALCHDPSSARAENPEDSLSVYAATITKTVTFGRPVAGFAIYIGHGEFLSAAHVVGRWHYLTRPMVNIGGLSLPATVVKMGSAGGIDIALLKVDEAKLPISLRLRLNPLCSSAPKVGAEVFGVAPNKVVRTRIDSPLTLNARLREKYGTIVRGVVTESGSGIFLGKTKCLQGIMAKSIQKFKYWPEGHLEVPDGIAGYFVPSTQIRLFLGLNHVAPEPPLPWGEN